MAHIARIRPQNSIIHGKKDKLRLLEGSHNPLVPQFMQIFTKQSKAIRGNLLTVQKA